MNDIPRMEETQRVDRYELLFQAAFTSLRNIS